MISEFTSNITCYYFPLMANNLFSFVGIWCFLLLYLYKSKQDKSYGSRKNMVKFCLLLSTIISTVMLNLKFESFLRILKILSIITFGFIHSYIVYSLLEQEDLVSCFKSLGKHFSLEDVKFKVKNAVMDDSDSNISVFLNTLVFLSPVYPLLISLGYLTVEMNFQLSHVLGVVSQLVIMY